MEQKNVSRRGFIGAAIGTGAAAAMTPSVALAGGKHGHGHGHGHGSSDSVPRNRRGMQMWTMRRLIEEGRQTPAEVFRTLGHLGYTEIELAGHYNLPARDLRRTIERNGMKAFSGHDGPNFPAAPGTWETNYREVTLPYAVEVGQKWTGLAWWPGPYDQEALWHQLAQHLNAAGRIAKDEFGLQFFYHNHDFEFRNRFSGKAAYDILLEETDPDYVKFELDLYWIVYGGESPVHYLSEDPARFPLYHVKDRTWRDRGPTIDDWEDTGPGSIDFPDIFEAGDGHRLDKHFVIEHDRPLLSHPGRTDDAEYITAAVSIDYLRNVRW